MTDKRRPIDSEGSQKLAVGTITYFRRAVVEISKANAL